jgi:hypothetical protein
MSDEITITSLGEVSVSSAGEPIVQGGTNSTCCCGFSPGACDPNCPIGLFTGLSVSFAGVSECTTAIACDGGGGPTATWSPGGATINGAWCLTQHGAGECSWTGCFPAGTFAWAGGCHSNTSGDAFFLIEVSAGGGIWDIGVKLITACSGAVAAVGAGQWAQVFNQLSGLSTEDCTLTFSNDNPACACVCLGSATYVGTGGTITIDLTPC